MARRSTPAPSLSPMTAARTKSGWCWETGSGPSRPLPTRAPSLPLESQTRLGRGLGSSSIASVSLAVISTVLVSRAPPLAQTISASTL